MTIGPRHTTIEKDPVAAALQGSENARDILEALRGKLTAHWFVVSRYRAIGDPKTLIPLGVSTFPVAVMLARVARIEQRSGAVTPVVSVQASYDFVWDGLNKTLFSYEPAGLTAGDTYSLVYLVGEQETQP